MNATLPLATPTFSVAALQARIAAARIATPAPVVLPADKTPRFVSQERNPRSVASIIEESGDLDCHSLTVDDNDYSASMGEGDWSTFEGA